jgi:nitrite reductase/ring-hydroxylating ferredoxin subunit
MLQSISARERLENNLAGRASMRLQDGTELRQLIDFENHTVSMRVLADPEIHRLELKHIFARSWIMVGHVSELPNPGDFVLRYIGQDQVIVTRGGDGDIHVLLNACSHRGMEVCRTDRGHARMFRCPYHGWTFRSDGSLAGAPFEREMYGEWDKSGHGLHRAGVAVRHGVIFGSFDPDPPSLETWMGEFVWYFDQMYGHAEFEVLSSRMPRQTLKANWKIAAEQQSGDGYHAASLHRGLIDLGLYNNPSSPADYGLDGHDVSTVEGHGLRINENAHTVLKIADRPEEFPVGWFVTGSMFPGVLVAGAVNRGGSHYVSMTLDETAPISRSGYLGTISPRGADSYTMWNFLLVEKDAAEEVREGMKKQAVSAAIGADDYVAWESIQRSARGYVAQERIGLTYNALLGENRPDGWPGPGLVHRGFSKDDNQWHFWLRWYDMMTADFA